jgi:hypothetical protein
MERQLLVAELPVLFEQSAAQHRLRRQALPSGLFHTAPAQVLRHLGDQRRMLVQPPRHRLQLTADLVSGEQIE